MIIRLILSPIRDMVISVEQVAAGNLAIKEIAVVSQDEVGRLGNAINTMVHALRRLVRQVSLSSEHVFSSICRNCLFDQRRESDGAEASRQ